MDCTVSLTQDTSKFTLTAIFANGSESRQSPPFSYLVDLTSPGSSNKPPQAVISVTPTTGTAPLAVSFDGGGSTDSDGSIASYAWSFGDGGTATGKSATHTYATAGTYTASLQVTDNLGATGTASVTIAVNNGSGQGTGNHQFGFTWEYNSTNTVKGFRIYQNAVLICQTNDPAARQLTCNADLATLPATYTLTAVNADDSETDPSNGVTYTGSSTDSGQELKAIIAADVVTGEVPLPVTFDGASSTGNVASYQWDFGDESTASTPSASHTYTTAGAYTAKLTVADDTGATDTATITITASAPAVPPTPPSAVISSSAATGAAPLTVNFDGSGSTATNATITSYDWSFGDNTSGTGATVSHTYISTGTYTATLTITDSNGQSNQTTIPVTVTSSGSGNKPPQAVISATPTTGPAPLAVSFDGGGSTDSDGSIASYAWSFGDGGTATGKSATHTYATAGTYTVTLQVTDNLGATGTASVTIAVNNGSGQGTGNHQFSFTWEYNSAATVKGFRIYQNAALICQTNDPAARQLTCLADLTTLPATYTVTAVNADDSETDPSNGVTYTGSNTDQGQELKAIIAADVVSGEVPLSVSFDGASSTGNVTSYLWDFGDESTASTPSASHTYTAAGMYTAKLTVADNAGTSDTASVTITASDPVVPPTPPTAVISSSTAAGTVPLTVNFDGSGSAATNATITSYDWDFGDNTSGTGAFVSHTYTLPGAYTITLTVNDSSGQSNQTTIPVTVTSSGSGNKPPQAVISATPTTGSAPLTVSFDGGGSIDSDGSITSYAWSFGDGGTTTGKSATHTYATAGTYTATLQVTDNLGATGTASVTIAVNNGSGQGTGNHQFSFTWEYDQAANIKGFRIYQNAALICQTNDPAARQLTCNADLATLPATYTLTAVNADNSETDPSNGVTYTGTNTDPGQELKAIIAANVVSGEVPLPVTFDGTSSTGTVTSYQWDFGDDSTANTPSASHTYTTAGTYTAKLTIADNTGASDTATITITASAPAVAPTPPAAIISSSAAAGAAPLTVHFDGSGSSATNATITSYDWDFGDDAVGSGLDISHTYTLPGTYTTTLTVTDSKGQSNSTTTPVIVTSPGSGNKAPQAIISAAPTTGPAPLAVSFDGGGSYDSDGTIVSYVWNFGDGGGTSTGKAVTHTYEAAGSYTATLQVTDNQGAIGIASVTITVNAGITGGYIFNFYWEYDSTATVKGFRIYQNAALICQTNNPAARQLTCSADLATLPATYTMTAINADGTETDPSNALTYTGDGSTGPGEPDMQTVLFYWSVDSLPQNTPIISNIGNVAISRDLHDALLVPGIKGTGFEQSGYDQYYKIPMTIVPRDKGTIRMYVRRDTPAGPDIPIYFFKSTNVNVANSLYASTTNSSISFCLYDINGVSHCTYGNVPRDNFVWYLYEFSWDAATGSIEVKIDGTTSLQTTTPSWSTSLPSWTAQELSFGSSDPIGCFDEIYITK